MEAEALKAPDLRVSRTIHGWNWENWGWKQKHDQINLDIIWIQAIQASKLKMLKKSGCGVSGNHPHAGYLICCFMEATFGVPIFELYIAASVFPFDPHPWVCVKHSGKWWELHNADATNTHWYLWAAKPISEEDFLSRENDPCWGC